MALLGGCRDFALAPPPPELPAGSIELVPQATYAAWWSDIERCVGKFKAMSRVSWFVVPNQASFTIGDGRYDGFWWDGVHWILLAGTRVDNPMVVRHEMLHEILGTGAHPAEFFMRRCGELVVCNGICRTGN
jgi:hypothetical protein